MLRTWSGAIAPLNKDDGQVVAVDIVMGLGRAARFGRQGDMQWTVLHHRTLCGFIWLRLGYPPEEYVYACGHDDHEYITGDLPSPFKAALNEAAGKQVTKIIERRIDARMNEHFNVKPPTDTIKRKVKYVDRLAGIMESLLFGPVLCDLHDVVTDEAERIKITADIEKVEPGFQAMVRRRRRA